MSIRKGTTIIAGNSSPLDWTGTLQEYNIALENGTIKENMVCYITDDTLYTDDIRPEIEILNSIKANKDLSNLSEVGEKHFLNKSQITNCITEVPQRIKYTLENGTLTIKAGSVVIVPYGTEDLTSQYPKGATFINDNFRVYDTQFASGKFFVWAEIQTDITDNQTGYTKVSTRLVNIRLDVNKSLTTEHNGSGETGYTGTNNNLYYFTNTNLIKYYSKGTITEHICSLPLLISRNDATVLHSSIDEVFNGVGYIGNVVWIDKGVKGLIPNGRNEDGTLKNAESIQRQITIADNVGWVNINTSYKLFIRYGQSVFNCRKQHYYEQPNEPEKLEYIQVWYNTSTNMLYRKAGSTNDEWVEEFGVCLGIWTRGESKDYIQSIQLNKPFRAVDYSDSSTVSGWGMPSGKYIDLTLGASKSSYIAPANGWIYISKKASGAGQYIFISGKGAIEHRSHSSSDIIKMMYPITKGQTFSIEYTLGGTTSTFQFIYAQGEA